MLKSWLIGVVVALIVFIGFIVVTAPAKLFVPLLALTVPQLQLASPSGTVWQGKSSQAYWRVNGSALDLGALEWSLSARSLLALKPRVQLKSQSLGHRLELLFTVDRQRKLQLSHFIGRLPLSMLEPWLPLLIAGNIDVLIDDLIVDLSDPQQPRIISLGGLINLQQAVWLVGDGDMLLGDYQADISLQEQIVAVDLSDHNAGLSLNGLLSIDLSGSYKLQAKLTPQPQLAAEISQSVKWLGKGDKNGSVLLSRQGRWR